MARNFCIYCGAELIPGRECACRAGMPKAEPVPIESPISSVSEKKQFCIYCGKQLADGEVCVCRGGAAVPPASGVTPPVISTLHETPRPAKTTSAPNPFLSKPTDLG